MRPGLQLAVGLLAIAPGLGFAAPARDGVTSLLGQRLFPIVASLDGSAAPAEVRSMLGERSRRYGACGEDAPCKLTAAAWTPSEIELTAGMAAKGRPAQALGDSGARAAVRRELIGLNAILDIYGRGLEARYPQIDGPIGKAGSERLKADLAVAMALADAGRGEPVAALDASIALALALIDVNDRLDAIAFEPLHGGLNAPGFERSRSLDWPRYPHTAIIVLGAGPDDLLTPLSARGKLHVRMAAQRYFDGQAPYIIVSGASVHPRETRYVEAVEMRRALIERYKVPAEAVLIEPYARHTTTNLRNAVRLLIGLKAPLDRDALILSSPPHIDWVASPAFEARNQRELGYMPGRIGKRTSPYDVTFRPSADSARVDPIDPLDP